MEVPSSKENKSDDYIANTQNANTTTQTQDKIIVGRRELFDVRTQLMAEDDVDEAGSGNAGHAELIAGLEQGDLKPNFYEGGFKTWECALDLSDVLLSDESQDLLKDEKGFHVIELGCGTAIPSLTLFAQLLSSSPISSEAAAEQTPRFRFTLADYNSTVLRMVTLSNFLLTWWINSSASPRRASEDSHLSIAEITEEDEGELDIDAAIMESFQTDLANRGIVLDFISGGWSPQFVELVLKSDNHITNTPTLILASETIYSPSSLGVFSETLLALLRNSTGSSEAEQQEQHRPKSTAFVAAKKVYFGVGGGVDEFLHVLDQQQLQDKESVKVQERKEITSGGVKRVVLEVGIDSAI